MANNVMAQVLGGQKRVLENVETVADVKRTLGVLQYSASINGEPARDSDSLEEGDFVTLSQAVKGGQ